MIENRLVLSSPGNSCDTSTKVRNRFNTVTEGGFEHTYLKF